MHALTTQQLPEPPPTQRDWTSSGWDAACRATPSATVFQTSSWLRCWSRHVAPIEGQTPILLRWPKTGPMRVGLALQVGDVAGRRTVTPLSWPWADYHEAVAHGLQDADLDAMAAALQNLAGAEEADLMLPDIRGGGVLKRICQRLSGNVTADTPVSRVDLTVPENVTAQAEKKEYIIKRRRLKRGGAMRLVQHRRPEALRLALTRFVALHTRQWAGRDDTVAPFTDPGVLAGFTAFAEELGTDGLIDITELYSGEALVAAYFGFVFRGTYYAYRTAFDRDAFRVSPGHLLLQELLAACAADGLHSFDFMRGGYAYKEAYATWAGETLRWQQMRRST
jgi:CelD/BcsL family acetyltransferase involved in cellulose biosynthesis